MKTIQNPLIKRIPKELIGEWRKYLVVSLLLILSIGFVSGMYVANGSMMQAAKKGKTDYKLEDGHFELNQKAEEELLAAIASGEKAEMKAYYLKKAKEELDEKFESEFKKEFEKEYEKEFSKQLLPILTGQGLDRDFAKSLLDVLLPQTEDSILYQESYREIYDKSHEEAYQKAWEELRDEVEEKYEEAVEKYALNDPDFSPVAVSLYENFYRNETEDVNGDGGGDGNIRVYKKTEKINLACLMEGHFPENEKQIAIDRMHADNAKICVGDHIFVGNQDFEVTGLLAYVNYSTLHEKNTDLIFDAIKFDVAMVTEEGFERIKSPIHYSYAWKYINTPKDEREEKGQSDDFLKALLTQTVAADRKIEDYIPIYANSAVNFATDDMGSDMAMGGVILDILIVIIAFIFAVTVSTTIQKEASAIGTLRASGYTKGELLGHYLAMPVIVTLFSAIVGNGLGYTLFKGIVINMYYNSYSLPSYHTLWNASAFIKTTLIPILLMLLVNFMVLHHMLRFTPQQFLRHDLRRKKRGKAVRLPKISFFGRFRLRIILQNLPNYLVLFAGIFFVAIMLAMAVGMPSTLKHYQKNVKDMMFCDYQYILKDYEDEEGKIIESKESTAEPFCLTSLLHRDQAIDEEISVYGIQADSQYVKIPSLDNLKKGQAIISTSFAEKYGLDIGDSVTLDEKYENKSYSFTVAATFDRSMSLAIFLPINRYRELFETDSQAFTGFLTNTELTDLSENQIASIITQREITKMIDQLDHSMGSYMTYFQFLCVLISALLIYLLTKIIIEKNESSISMIKILGYEDKEIFRLYLLSTTFVLLIIDAICTLLGVFFMAEAWKAIMFGYSGWFTFHMEALSYLKIFLLILIGYLIVLFFDFRRIKKIPMDQALKMQ